jgi:hypothetical protein
LDFSVVSKPTISKGQPGPGPDDEETAPAKAEKNGKAKSNGIHRGNLETA